MYIGGGAAVKKESARNKKGIKKLPIYKSKCYLCKLVKEVRSEENGVHTLTKTRLDMRKNNA